MIIDPDVPDIALAIAALIAAFWLVGMAVHYIGGAIRRYRGEE